MALGPLQRFCNGIEKQQKHENSKENNSILWFLFFFDCLFFFLLLFRSVLLWHSLLNGTFSSQSVMGFVWWKERLHFSHCVPECTLFLWHLSLIKSWRSCSIHRFLSLSLIRYRSIRVILCGCNCSLNKIIKKNARQRKERMNDGVETFIHKKFASKWFIMPDSNAIELFVRNIQVRFSLLMHICCSEKFKWNELFLLEKRLQMIQWNFERNSPI